MSIVRKLAIPVLTLALSACFPLSSKHPLGNRSFDPHLVGVWQNDEVEMRFTRSGRNTLSLKFSTLDEDAVSEPRSFYYTILPSEIRGKHFLSAKQIFPKAFLEDYAAVNDISYTEARRKFRNRDHRMNGYYLGHYRYLEVEGLEHLGIYLIDEDSEIVKVALETGNLKGNTTLASDEDGEESELLHLTSSSRALTRFVADNTADLDDLFGFEIANLTRVE